MFSNTLAKSIFPSQDPHAYHLMLVNEKAYSTDCYYAVSQILLGHSHNLKEDTIP